MEAVAVGGGRGGGGVLLHAKAPNVTYYMHQYTQGSGSRAGKTPVTEATGKPALPFDLSEFLLSDDDQVAIDPDSNYVEPPTGAAALPTVRIAGHNGEQFSTLCSVPSSSHNSDGIRIAAQRGSGRSETAIIAFRTKSDVEILDDGFKWRKYGKKSVKSNSHPRNYYMCSNEGCLVKKRVERDRENPSYVITTYEGRHNHMSPGVIYYTTQDAATGQFYVAGYEMPPSS